MTATEKMTTMMTTMMTTTRGIANEHDTMSMTL